MLSNLAIELSDISLGYQVDKAKTISRFSIWRNRALLYFAEFASTKLSELHSILTLSIEAPPKPRKFDTSLKQNLELLILELSKEINNGLYDGLLAEIDLDKQGDFYNLTNPQKRLLRILVNFKENNLLFEPIILFSQADRLRLQTSGGINLYPKTVIPEFKQLDLSIFAEENLVSHTADQNGARSQYTLKQSALVAVHNHFYPPVSTPFDGSQALGSPYGFTQADWVFVKDQRSKRNTVVVSVGHKFKTDTYISAELITNLQKKFEQAIARFNANNPEQPISLDFKVLGAGYGEHLFNDIARNIMSSDISVFETSDLNPNVMIEMGVALTWGVSVLPIKKSGKPEPPSDISGQTWADYEANGDFTDPNFDHRLLDLVTRVISRKRGSQ